MGDFWSGFSRNGEVGHSDSCPTSNSSGCERKWGTFSMKIKNNLSTKKLEILVLVILHYEVIGVVFEKRR